jgi:hypothetical protein
LAQALSEAGFAKEEDFHLLDVETTMYKGRGDKSVFVQDEENTVDEVIRHSEMISAFRDKPEIESFLVVLNQSKAEAIKKRADQGQFLLRRSKQQGPTRILPQREKKSDRTSSDSPSASDTPRSAAS